MSIDINKWMNSYEFDCTLPGTNEVIMFKPVTTGQLKKLLPYEDEENSDVIERVLDGLISDCVISEGFNIDNLYLQDRFHLLLEIRKKSKGEAYEFIYICPECESRTPITLDLNNLKVEKHNGKGLFKLNDDLSFDMDFVTRGEQKIIFDMIDKKKLEGNMKRVEQATYLYAKAMKTFHTPDGDTEVSIEDKVNLLDNVMSDTKYKEFIKWFEDNQFGTEFKFDFQCGNCKHKQNYDIPMTNFFA